MAAGEYFVLLPHDDILLPGALKEFVLALENKSIGLVYSAMQVIDKNGDVVEIEEVKSPHSALTKAAISGLSKLPKLNPGTQRLNPVAVKLEIPVRFMLSR